MSVSFHVIIQYRCKLIIATPFWSINPTCLVWLGYVLVHPHHMSSLPSGTLHTAVYLLQTKNGCETCQLSRLLLLCGVSTVGKKINKNGSSRHLSSKVMPVSEKHASSIINLLINVTCRIYKQAWRWRSSEQKGDAPKNAKVSDVRFDLRVTNHWIACIPRQRHSNRPLVLSCHACRGVREGRSGWERSQEWDEMDTTSRLFHPQL